MQTRGASRTVQYGEFILHFGSAAIYPFFLHSRGNRRRPSPARTNAGQEYFYLVIELVPGDNLALKMREMDGSPRSSVPLPLLNE